MREPVALGDAACPHSVRDQAPPHSDSHDDLPTPLPSASELAAHNERARLRRAVADFAAVSHAGHPPPHAVVTRCDAFFAAYSRADVLEHTHAAVAPCSLNEVREPT
jgi:hypothetical protein